MALSIHDLQKEKVGACVSGGLDSRTIAKRLTEAGVPVVAFAADLGQPDEAVGVAENQQPGGGMMN